MESTPTSADERLLALGRRIRVLRKSVNLSQEQLAHKAGLHRAFVGFIERGERDFGVSNVWALAEALEVPIGELFES